MMNRKKRCLQKTPISLIKPDNSPNIFSPYVGNENTILKDESVVSENTIRALDFGEDDEERTYQVIGSYESVSDYI